MCCGCFADALYVSMRQKGAAQTAHGKIRGAKHKKSKVTKVNYSELKFKGWAIKIKKNEQ